MKGFGQFKSRLNRGLHSIWAPIILGGSLLVLIVGLRLVTANHEDIPERPPVSEEKKSEEVNPTFLEIKNALDEVLLAYQIKANKSVKRNSKTEIWKINIPADLSAPSLHFSVQEQLESTGARILAGQSDPVTGKISLNIGWKDSSCIQLHLIPSEKLQSKRGQIGLVIDDFGDRYDDFIRSFLTLDVEKTISILPGRQFSEKVAEEARRMGCEVILHLPMEPEKMRVRDDGYTIMQAMSQTQIETVFKRCYLSVPGAVGVNNHMGSKVTADRRVMSYLFEPIKLNDLYFLDSRTTAATVAYQLAEEMGLRCGKRDIFFDVELNKVYIQKMLGQLAQKAEKQGFSIGIGHCNSRTLEVLREEVPKFKEKGFSFVRLSELVR